MPQLSIDRLQELLSYDVETGLFRWKCGRRGSKNTAGQVAGTIKGEGKTSPLKYVVIWVDGRLYRAHRLAWFYVHGEWPSEGIDHIDGDGLNNRFSNLRQCTQQQNNGNIHNLHRTNTSGFRGVSWKKDKQKWKAFINRQNRQYHLGYFDTAEDAYEAYKRAAIDHFGEFAKV